MDRKELKKHLAEGSRELVVGAGKEDLVSSRKKKEQIKAYLSCNASSRLRGLLTTWTGSKENAELKKPCEILFHC